jgi:toxin FitB
MMQRIAVYLVDTDVVSESRKGSRANAGVRRFFVTAKESQNDVYISVITIGELRRGVELLRHRRDDKQALQLDKWLGVILDEYDEQILDFSREEAQVWGRLRVPRHENALDKQIAAIALTHDLTLVTRNTDHFEKLGLSLLNPFETDE